MRRDIYLVGIPQGVIPQFHRCSRFAPLDEKIDLIHLVKQQYGREVFDGFIIALRVHCGIAELF